MQTLIVRLLKMHFFTLILDCEESTENNWVCNQTLSSLYPTNSSLSSKCENSDSSSSTTASSSSSSSSSLGLVFLFRKKMLHFIGAKRNSAGFQLDKNWTFELNFWFPTLTANKFCMLRKMWGWALENFGYFTSVHHFGYVRSLVLMYCAILPSFWLGPVFKIRKVLTIRMTYVGSRPFSYLHSRD